MTVHLKVFPGEIERRAFVATTAVAIAYHLRRMVVSKLLPEHRHCLLENNIANPLTGLRRRFSFVAMSQFTAPRTRTRGCIFVPMMVGTFLSSGVTRVLTEALNRDCSLAST